MTADKISHSSSPKETSFDLSSGCPFGKNRKDDPEALRVNGQPKFFSLFNLPARPFDSRFTIALGQEMGKPYPLDPRGLSNIPSGYVYLGQFIVHDITQQKGALDFPRHDQEPIELLTQLSNPSLELDSIYGDSVHDNSYDNPNIPLNQGAMMLGSSMDMNGQKCPGTDLPRQEGTLEPLIGDARNDENMIAAQLHLQFLKLHNWFHKKFAKIYPLAGPEDLYRKARKEVILHYQEIVLYDFLRKLLDKEVWSYVIDGNHGTVWNPSPGEQARIPVEFSGAAMRFGHSMIRPSYSINEEKTFTIEEIFYMTGRGKFRNSTGLSSANLIDWRCFFNEEPRADDPPINFAKRIGPRVDLRIPGFAAVTGYHYDAVAVRNLGRANQLKLPAGEDIAELLLKDFGEMCCEIGLNGDYVRATTDRINDEEGRIAKVIGHDIHGLLRDKIKSPLWYYILEEASHHEAGQRLGKIGSLIVAEVFLGLARMSRISYYFSCSDPYLPPLQRTGQHPTKNFNRHLRMADILKLLATAEKNS